MFPYALSPLPSNYLFIAYGLSDLPFRIIAAAFFVGRATTYAIWAHLGRFASNRLDLESGLEGSYLGGFFIVTQLVLLGLVFMLMKLDWLAFFNERRLTFRRGHRPRGPE
ncbi:hypothetical protein FEP70_01668 [Burkholderia multivorans]|nr:hypothetical protein [Burkholderia multivorans]